MFIKTNIPETTGSLDGTLVGFGDTHRPLDRLILNDQAERIQVVAGGNRCGHDPQSPRYYLRPENHQPRPSVLEEAIRALKEAYRFPKKFLQSLGLLNPKNRRKRSERREAVVSVSQVLLHYLDLATLKVGFNTSVNAFVTFDLRYIAGKAGTTLVRAKRAIKDMEKAGYIKIARQFTRKDDGSFIGLPSVREITVRFFTELGVDVMKLFFSREWKRKKEEKKAAKQARNKLRGIMMQAVTSFSSFYSAGKALFSKRSIKSRPHPTIDKALISQALSLHRENPARSPSDYLKELQRKKE